jgi:hypothetical protein
VVRHRRAATVSLAAYVVLVPADVLAELNDAYLLSRILPVLLMPLLAGSLCDGRRSRLATLGGVIFLVSDLVLAYGAFVDPPASAGTRALIMAT